jgi:hypothetical protein
MRVGEMTRIGSYVAASLMLSFATVGFPAVAAGQAPRRQEEVEVPGLGIKIKAGWRVLFADGCRFAAPPSWQTAPGDKSLALAPDGSNLSVRIVRFSSWSDHKARIKAAYGQLKTVHEDTDRRLWFEVGDEHRTQHFIDVANAEGACLALLELRTPTKLTSEDISRIADSVGPIPVHWPQDEARHGSK